jgi:hypothetical protein
MGKQRMDHKPNNKEHTSNCYRMGPKRTDRMLYRILPEKMQRGSNNCNNSHYMTPGYHYYRYNYMLNPDRNMNPD